MPRLRARGENTYVEQQKPDEKASAEAKVVFAAFREVVESLLARAATADKSEVVQSGLMLNYVMLKKVYDEMTSEMEQIEFILQLTERKLMSLEG